MGTWGYGMLSSDEALDVCYRYQEKIERVIQQKGRGLLPLLRVVARSEDKNNYPAGILGVCQGLLNNGVIFPDEAVRFLYPWIGQALVMSHQFEAPEKVSKALGHFAMHLLGPDFSILTKKDNKGLLFAIAEHFRGES